MHHNKRIIMWLRSEYGDGNDNVKTVIEALEKQIPKKPKMEEDDFDYGVAYVCQVCGTFIAYETDILSGYCKVNYCTECGNAILWGEEND